jgi:hypothetical protein
MTRHDFLGGDVYETDTNLTTGTGAGTSSTAKDTAKQAGASAKQVAGDVTGTAKEQGKHVAGAVGAQARSVLSDVRQTVKGQVGSGHSAAADQVRKFAEDLGGLTGGDTSSPAGRVVSQLSDTGHRAADYLQDRGPEGLLEDVQSFARRKPGTFLLAAAAAGFVIGRLGRSTVKAARSDDTPSTGAPTGNLYQSTPEYGTATYVEDTYVAPTQTQTYASTAATGAAPNPVPVDYDYPVDPVDPVVVPDRETLR